MNSQVKQNLKGHHLRDILPPLPEKPLKSFTDHRDPSFIKDRQMKLEIYLTALVAIPHVSDMICVKAFLGLMDQVREYSVSFHVPTLGMSLIPSGRPEQEGVPVLVGAIQKPESGPMASGDSISKINGVPVAGLNFNGVVTRIKVLPRPIIVHFIQVIGAQPADPAALRAAASSAQAQAEEEEAKAAAASNSSSGNNNSNNSGAGNGYSKGGTSWQSYHGQDGQDEDVSDDGDSEKATVAVNPEVFQKLGISPPKPAPKPAPQQQPQAAARKPQAPAPAQPAEGEAYTIDGRDYEDFLAQDQHATSHPPPAPAPAPAPAAPKVAVPIGWD